MQKAVLMLSHAGAPSADQRPATRDGADSTRRAEDAPDARKDEPARREFPRGVPTTLEGYVDGREALDLEAVLHLGPVDRERVAEAYVLSQNRKGCAVLAEGDKRRALLYLNRARRCLRELGFFRSESVRERLMALTFNNLGCLFRHEEKFTEALAFLHEAVHLEHRLELAVPGSVANPAETLLNLGSVMSKLGRHPVALEVTLEAIRMLERSVATAVSASAAHAHRSALAVAFFNLGTEHEHLRQWAQAIEAHQRAYTEAVHSVGDRSAVAQHIRLAWREAEDHQREEKLHRSLGSSVAAPASASLQFRRMEPSPDARRPTLTAAQALSSGVRSGAGASSARRSSRSRGGTRTVRIKSPYLSGLAKYGRPSTATTVTQLLHLHDSLADPHRSSASTAAPTFVVPAPAATATHPIADESIYDDGPRLDALRRGLWTASMTATAAASPAGARRPSSGVRGRTRSRSSTLGDAAGDDGSAGAVLPLAVDLLPGGRLERTLEVVSTEGAWRDKHFETIYPDKPHPTRGRALGARPPTTVPSVTRTVGIYGSAPLPPVADPADTRRSRPSTAVPGLHSTALAPLERSAASSLAGGSPHFLDADEDFHPTVSSASRPGTAGSGLRLSPVPAPTMGPSPNSPNAARRFLDPLARGAAVQDLVRGISLDEPRPRALAIRPPASAKGVRGLREVRERARSPSPATPARSPLRSVIRDAAHQGRTEAGASDLAAQMFGAHESLDHPGLEDDEFVPKVPDNLPPDESTVLGHALGEVLTAAPNETEEAIMLRVGDRIRFSLDKQLDERLAALDRGRAST